MKTFNFQIKAAMALLGVIFLAKADALACKMSRDPKMNYFISYQDQRSGMFGTGQKREVSPTVIERCQQAAGQYLMLSLGLKNAGLSSDVADISFDGKLGQDNCSIANLPQSIKAQGFAEKKSFFEEQFKALRSCSYLRIWELDDRKIEFSANQPNCKMTLQRDGSVTAEGNLCFLKIMPTNRFAVSVNLYDRCKDPNYLKENGINPMDIEALMNAYVTGDDTGYSTDVTPIGSTRVRLALTADDKLLPLSESFDGEVPRFPVEFTPQIAMGSVTLNSLGDNRLAVDLSLVVDSRSQITCKNGFCSSPGNYNTPIVGEVELYEHKPNGRKEFIDNWWFAGIAPPRWQGLMRNNVRNIEEWTFAPGKRYSLSVTFIDPYNDYDLYLRGMQELLIDLKQTQGTAGIDIIPALQSINAMTGIPLMQGLPNITSDDLNTEMERVLQVLQKLGMQRDWPPYYEEVCDPTRSSCKRTGINKFYLKLTTDFTLGQMDENTMSWSMNNLLVRQESPVFGNDKIIGGELPKITCGGF